jgi:rubrerythrin
MGFERDAALFPRAGRCLGKDVVDEIINEEKSHVRWLSEFRENFKRQG